MKTRVLIWSRTAAILASALVLILVAPAFAAPTGPTGAPATASLPAFKVSVAGTYKHRGRRYVLPRTRLEVKGSVDADLSGQTVTIVVKKRGRVAKSAKSKLTVKAGKSSFDTPLRIGAKGKYTIGVELTADQQLVAQAGDSPSVNIVKTAIHRGSKGVSVKVFQHALGALHYVVPHNGRFDAATGRALMAFRKVNGMKRIESAGKKVAGKLASGGGGFHLRHAGAGRHVEVSIRRQVMAFADNGKVVRIYHVSTGAPGTPTVRGTFHVYRKDWGTNQKGMVHSNYFIRGYAIHGYASVPPYNASHGCVRVPVPNAASIFGWVHMGTRVDVY